MRGSRSSTTKAARRIVAETANELRAKLRRSRDYVSPRLQAYAGQRRGSRMAEGLTLLTASMVDAKMTQDEARERFARMGASLYDVEVRDRAA